MSPSRFLLSAFLLAFSIGQAQFTDVINANRPSKSISPFSVGKTVLQAEAGFYGFNEDHRVYDYNAKGFGSELSVRYGVLLEQLEAILDLEYQNEDVTYHDIFNNEYLDGNRGIHESRIGAKYLLYDPLKNHKDKPNLYSWKANHGFKYRSLIPAIGAYAGFNYNLAGRIFDRPGYPEQNKVSPTVALLTQNQFGRFVLVTNIAGDRLGSNRESINYVVTVTHGINMRWSAFLELQGYNSDFYSDNVIRGGAAFLPWENIQLDASFGTTMKDTPSAVNVGVGISWRFDDLYEDIYLREPKEKKEQSKLDKKMEKAAKKEKKRKDSVSPDEKTDMK